MVGSNASETPTGDHESLSGSVPPGTPPPPSSAARASSGASSQQRAGNVGTPGTPPPPSSAARAGSGASSQQGAGNVGTLGTLHETWDAGAEIEVKKPEFSDDGAGEGWGMLEGLPGSDQSADTPDGFVGPVAGPLLAASPWSWVLRLEAAYEDGSKAVYAGWLASPRVVVTCGRCLFDPSRGEAREVSVGVGLNGSVGRRHLLKSSEFRMVKGWVNSANPECDYGAILLPGPGSTGIGHFGLAWLPGARPKDEWLNLSGYSVDGSDTDQRYEGFRVADANDRFLYRTGGFHAAAAGSPLWLYLVRDGRAQRYVCGMVGSNADSGDALRLHRDIYANLLNWIEKAKDATEAEPSGNSTKVDGG